MLQTHSPCFSLTRNQERQLCRLPWKCSAGANLESFVLLLPYDTLHLYRECASFRVRPFAVVADRDCVLLLFVSPDSSASRAGSSLAVASTLVASSVTPSSSRPFPSSFRRSLSLTAKIFLAPGLLPFHLPPCRRRMALLVGFDSRLQLQDTPFFRRESSRT